MTLDIGLRQSPCVNKFTFSTEILKTTKLNISFICMTRGLKIVEFMALLPPKPRGVSSVFLQMSEKN